MLKHRKQTPN